MSVRDALRFFSAAAADPTIRKAVADLPERSELSHLTAIARESGFDVTEDELREAFAADARLRKIYYASSDQA